MQFRCAHDKVRARVASQKGQGLMGANRHDRRQEAGPHAVWLGAALGIYAVPALIALARESWVGEAGSLAPVVLVIGVWSLVAGTRTQGGEASREPHQLSLTLWLAGFIPVTLAYLFFASIGMPAGMGLCAWLGVLITLPVWLGRRFLRANLIPVLFMALVIPVPYTLSATANAVLRGHVAEWAAKLGHGLGMDVALGTDGLVVGPYTLAVENACAGLSTTVTLLAIGLLFAFWTGHRSVVSALVIALMALPIALAVNLLRVLALMGLVSVVGPDVLDTVWHPVAGLISFALAAVLLAGVGGAALRFTGARTA